MLAREEVHVELGAGARIQQQRARLVHHSVGQPQVLVGVGVVRVDLDVHHYDQWAAQLVVLEPSAALFHVDGLVLGLGDVVEGDKLWVRGKGALGIIVVCWGVLAQLLGQLVVDDVEHLHDEPVQVLYLARVDAGGALYQQRRLGKVEHRDPTVERDLHPPELLEIVFELVRAVEVPAAHSLRVTPQRTAHRARCTSAQQRTARARALEYTHTHTPIHGKIAYGLQQVLKTVLLAVAVGRDRPSRRNWRVGGRCLGLALALAHTS